MEHQNATYTSPSLLADAAGGVRGDFACREAGAVAGGARTAGAAVGAASTGMGMPAGGVTARDGRVASMAAAAAKAPPDGIADGMAHEP